MIELSGIVKRYHMGEEEILALNGVDLHIGRNEYVALIGASGSGKSTLMNLIGCLDTPSEGRYVLNGRDTSTMNDNELAKVRNQEIGFVFQSFHLLPRLTVLENVLLPLRYRGEPDEGAEARARDLLGRVGLDGRIDHRPGELSGGQMQRAAIARALVMQPPLLLADEPTGNLDSRSAADVLALLEELNAEGQTLVIVTHDPEIAARAGRSVHLRDGRIAEVRS